MVISRHSSGQPPLEVQYAAHRRHRLLPIEVVTRRDVLDRIAGRELAERQRPNFHQLIVCMAGSGTHHVDYESIELSAGMMLRTHPGQVQRFETSTDLEALMVVWPHESHHSDPDGREWYPGSAEATYWRPNDQVFAKILTRVEELEREQERFDGSERHIALMKAMLAVLLLRLAMEFADLRPDTGSALPSPYIEYRRLIEERLRERPVVSDLASDLGYSSRTLDRVCQQVSGQTAKQVLDERTALEIQRLLTHSVRPIARVAADFGFTDPSNFSKYVKRHLGRLPREVRSEIETGH